MRSTLPLKVLAIALTLGASPIQAGGPEQLDQLEPARGEWQAEYYGQFGGSEKEGRQHSLELFYGLSERFSLGVEVAGEREDGRMEFDEASLIGLMQFSDAEDDPLGTGLMISAGIDSGGRISELEARFISEKITERWWAQANIMLRRVDEEDVRGEMLAYGWSLSRSLSKTFWLGLEGSGQAARLGGFEQGFKAAHFAGPSATIQVEAGEGREIEIGLAYFRRLHHEGPRDTARLFLQFGL